MHTNLPRVSKGTWTHVSASRPHSCQKLTTTSPLHSRLPAVELNRYPLMLLKMRLLLQALDEVAASELHPLVIREADIACVMADRTAFPQLVFPCLFAERVAAALRFQAWRERSYW